MNIKRNSRNQQLINDGLIWKNENNRWCRKCPCCFNTIEHSVFTTCSTFVNKKCDKCSRINRPHKKSQFVRNIIDTKLIWTNNLGQWYKTCSKCSGHQSYSTLESCLSQYKNNTLCSKCAVPRGINHCLYGKHRTDSTKRKLRISLLGKHKGRILSDKHKRKISESLLKNTNRIIKNNGVNQFKWKQYIFPDGRKVNVQGYEPWTIDYLLSNSVAENDIKIKEERPIISYNWSGSKYQYLPDCYIKSQNTLVETKSEWTWNNKLEQNIAKISGSLDCGYNIRVVIWNPKKEIVCDKIYSS